MDGGASSAALPHWKLGLSPICSTSVPPFAISDCRNQGLLSG